MATDFQLIEADHARRKELVDQLSTTVFNYSGAGGRGEPKAS